MKPISHAGATVPEIMRERALAEPDFPLFNFLRYGRGPDAPLTLHGLDQSAIIIAHELHARGISNGIVLLLYLPGLEFIRAFFGCLYAGLTAVPVHPGRGKLQGRGELLATISHTKCRAILTNGGQIKSTFEALDAAGVATQLPLIDTTTLDSTTDTHSWRAPVTAANAAAYIQYTSGSSSSPKGVVVSHHNILSNLQASQQRLELVASDVSLSWLPMNHDMGLIGNVLAHAIYGRQAQHVMSPLAFMVNPLRWLRAVADFGVTITGGPNFAFDLCVRKITEQDKKNLDLSSWTIAYCGAEPIRYDTLEHFAAYFASCGFDKNAFCAGYGLAESTLMVASAKRASGLKSLSVDRAALRKGIATTEGVNKFRLVSCGSAIEGHDIIIVDAETYQVLPENHVGEVWVQGPSVTNGYFQSSIDNNDRFNNPHPITKSGSYLRTGDLGFLCSQELYITGRLKDVIIIRGKNFMPDPIESTAIAANTLLLGSSAAALPLMHNSGEALLLIVEASTQLEQQISVNLKVAEEIYNNVRTSVLETHELDVAEFVLVKFANIPKTTSGKIQRRQCLENYTVNKLAIIYKATSL